jgi:hypothetical protein
LTGGRTTATGGRASATGGSAEGGAAGAACPEPPPGPGEGGVFDGSLSIAGPDDAAEADLYSEITGDLVIESSYEGVLELPNLVTIGGRLDVQSPLINNNTAVDYGRMTELHLPNLETIGGALYLYLLTALVETDFRNLTSVGGDVYIYRVPNLRRVRLDALNAAGSVYFADDFALPKCEMDAICGRLGSSNCQSGDEDCTCAEVCGLFTPDC